MMNGLLLVEADFYFMFSYAFRVRVHASPMLLFVRPGKRQGAIGAR